VDTGRLADPGQVDGVGGETDEQVEEACIDGDQKGEGEGDAEKEDAEEAAVGDLAERQEEGAEDHTETQVVIAATSGRGRSGGTDVSVPIWIRPATHSPWARPR
jgi:hypothetical protein